MKTILLFLIPAIAFVSCNKQVAENKTTKTNTLVSKQSYAVVRCDNCKIVYQTSGKVKDLNVSGISPNLIYKYSPGTVLKANIYPTTEDQDIIYTVYNPEGQIVYHNILDQSGDEPLDVNVLLP